MARPLAIQSAIEAEGFVIVNGILPHQSVISLLHAVETIGAHVSVQKRGSTFAVRNLLSESPEILKLATSRVIRELVQPFLGTEFFPVRGILFDKVPQANWKVPWHQDLTIAVQDKIEVEGFGPWSVKTGIHHVQPPASVLENMLTVRLHLDPCTADNGALRVVPGSHRFGKIPETQIGALLERFSNQTCEVATGGALVMRPLLLHASSPSQAPQHRRVIHLDFACGNLPQGLQWFERVH